MNSYAALALRSIGGDTLAAHTERKPRKLVNDMRAIPHIEATDSDVLRDTIRHHDVLIGEAMEAAADRYQQRRKAGLPGLDSSLPLAPTELDDLVYRFLLVLTVACELAARPPATGE
jgi:hypothetical protein